MILGLALTVFGFFGLAVLLAIIRYRALAVFLYLALMPFAPVSNEECWFPCYGRAKFSNWS